ncbi:hypothetical protein ACCO45_007460 [Purpureocillium lilacinum]|uniref:Uncharacterized protein n=1 Tax=Purpureocillium lilacinum TaxID=33203 RepID=A0ACC4DTE7_PURLI
MAWPGTARTTEQFASHLARPKNRCQRSALPSRRLKRSAWDDAYVLAFPTVRAAEGLACKPRPACREPVPLARGPSQVPVIFIWWHHGQPARHEPLQRDAHPSGTYDCLCPRSRMSRKKSLWSCSPAPPGLWLP